MSAAHFAGIFKYNERANAKVWNCVMALSDEKFTQDLDYSQGAIYNQVVHTMGVEYWWMHFLRTGELDFINPKDYPDRAAIRAKWDAINDVNRAYVASLTPEELERDVRPEFWEPELKPIKMWQGFMQVMFHSMDHRAQTLAMLHRLGAPTIEQDYLYDLFDLQLGKIGKYD